MSVPASEWSQDFVDAMKARMEMSYHKYGAVRDAYPHKVNALESLRLRLDKYIDTGNTEFIVDAANFCLIEFLCPSHPRAHFKATDSRESPGRAAYDTSLEPTQAGNKQLTDREWNELRGAK